MTLSAEQLMARLDKRPAPPEARAEIAFRILQEANKRDPLVEGIMEQYRRGFPSAETTAAAREELGAARDANWHCAAGDLFHLAWGLLPSADRLDGYLAEFYYDWAQTLGLCEERTSAIVCEVARL
jgi:hypothetical protein